jgi:glucose/arabinose dehydrogenase
LEHIAVATGHRARFAIRNGLATALFSSLSLFTPCDAGAEVSVGEPQVNSVAAPPESLYVNDSDFPYELRKIVSGQLVLPWSIAFLPDGRMLVTERPGRLRVVEGDHMLPESISGVPEVTVGGHSGLLDVLVDKDFPNTHRLFLSYMHGSPESSTIRIVRARLDGMELIDKQVIFESRPWIKGTDQIGGRLAFGPDGMLYLTIGDRFQMERAQNQLDDGGKIIRLRDDGTIPDDNPFVGHADILPEIYSYGHRNPQGLIGNAGGGQLWSVEQGPKGGDELNLITSGGNYGWPLVTYGINYDDTIISDKTSAPGLIDPIHYWVPSLATASLVSYSGNVMPDDWQGNLLIGTLVGQCLVRLEVTNGVVTAEHRYFHHTIGRIRDIAISPDGYIYLLSDGTEASLYRLEPSNDLVAKAKQ